MDRGSFRRTLLSSQFRDPLVIALRGQATSICLAPGNPHPTAPSCFTACLKVPHRKTE